MRAKLLILNGSHSEITLIEAAKRLGYYVITTGNMPNLIGHAFADEYIMADYSDKEKILELVKENGITRIVSCANDFGAITASYVAEQLGWPGHDTYENMLRLHQKDQFKQFANEIGLRSPLSTSFTSVEAAQAFCGTAAYPIIVKAVDLTGGKGIQKATTMEEAKAAIENAFCRSRAKHIVIEPFLEGQQQSIVTFVIGKRVIASVSNNCYSPINPYLIQTEILPGDGIEFIQEELHGMIEMICRRLNLVDGIFTLQYIVCDGKPYVIEMMRRCLGNQYLTAAGAVSGFPWEEALVRAETGMDLTCLQWTKPMAKNSGHHGVMATRNGTVKGYTIDPTLEKHIFKKIEVIKPGERLNDYMNERIAYLYYTYDDRAELVKMAEHINELVHVEFED